MVSSGEMLAFVVGKCSYWEVPIINYAPLDATRSNHNRIKSYENKLEIKTCCSAAVPNSCSSCSVYSVTAQIANAQDYAVINLAILEALFLL